MIEIEVEYEGKPEKVMLDDNLTFGELEDVISRFVKTGEILRGSIDIDVSAYNMAITVLTVKKAPWKLGDEKALRALPVKEGRKVVREATKMYPLQDSLLEWVAAVQGGDESE